MLSRRTRRSLAMELMDAEASGRIVEGVSARYPEASLEDAYAIQNCWRDHLVEGGETIAGRKVGVTSRALQSDLGTSGPVYGFLPGRSIRSSGDVTSAIGELRVEVELAFVLARELKGPECSEEDVMRATDCVVPALEVVSRRSDARGRTLVDVVADNVGYHAIVLGDQRVAVDESIDLGWVGAILYRNDEVEDTGVSAAVLGHPARSVAWLANELVDRGEFLDSGDLIMSGSFVRPLTISSGDRIVCDFGRFGTVACRFS